LLYHDNLKSKRDQLLGPLVLLATVILFYWKLVLTHQYTWLETPDMANLVLPWLQFQAGEWHHHRFPLWDPNSWFGQPLFGQAQPGSAYPLNWLLFLAPLKNGWLRESSLNWYFVLMRGLAALTAYAFARDLGRSRLASLLAGCVYALGGYVAFTRAPQMVNGAVWTPLVFLYLLRAERGQRPWASALLSGFFLGCGWLAGHHQMNLFVSIAAAGLWIWLCICDGKINRQMALLAAGSLGIAVLASGFQTLPTAEYGRLAVRWTGAGEPQHFDETVPYTVHEDYALKPLGILGIFIPGIAGGSAPGADPYVGIVAFGLALLGTILTWRDRQVRCLAALSLGGILFSLGPNSLLHGVLYALVPLVEKARMPGAGTVVFSVGLAPLAAFGVDALRVPASSEWSRRFGWALGGIAGVLALLSLILYAAKIPSGLGDDRIMMTALAAALAAGLLAAWRAGAISARAGAVAATCLVLLELANVNGYSFPNRSKPADSSYLSAMSQHSDLADYVRGHDMAARVAYDDTLIPYNIGDWYGIEAVNAYTASVLANIWDMNLFSKRGRDFFGVKYYFGKTPQSTDWKDVYAGRTGLKVFENPTAYPRVWSVHQAVVLPDSSEARRRKLDDPAFDPRHAVVLSQAPPDLGGCGANSDDIQMPQHLPNYVRVEAHLGCRGMVILTDPYFPGWRAYVDGKRVPLLETYGGVRGVVVETGDHLVEMRYRPLSVLVGAVMTLLAALITLAVNRR
jgi:Bacterial membrane protein YfhO